MHRGTCVGQRTTASVTGSIVDASESAVPRARVVARSLATGVETTVESNDLGYYVVPAVPAGPYSLTFSKTGFQTQTVPQLVLEVDQNATINISMKVGAIAETVTVSAETAEVDTRTATLNTVINQKQIAELPLNGRNVLVLMQLTPVDARGVCRHTPLSFILKDHTKCRNVPFNRIIASARRHMGFGHAWKRLTAAPCWPAAAPGDARS
jgi:carboxypeptidase family protein